MQGQGAPALRQSIFCCAQIIARPLFYLLVYVGCLIPLMCSLQTAPAAGTACQAAMQTRASRRMRGQSRTVTGPSITTGATTTTSRVTTMTAAPQ